MNSSYRVRCDSIQLCHAFDFTKCDFFTLVKQMTDVRDACHQTILFLTTRSFIMIEISP